MLDDLDSFSESQKWLPVLVEGDLVLPETIAIVEYLSERFPDRAKKRYDEAVAERRVESHSNPDGTADLCARQLPPHRVAAITERIHTLAKHLKRHGDERTIDQIRADIPVADR